MIPDRIRAAIRALFFLAILGAAVAAVVGIIASHTHHIAFAASHAADIAVAMVAAVGVARRPLLTRKHGVDRLREVGIPITLSTMNKHCAAGTGPEPAGVFGSRDLYEEDELLRWAQARIEAGKAARAAVKANKAADSPPAVADTEITPRRKRGRPPRKTAPEVANPAAAS